MHRLSKHEPWVEIDGFVLEGDDLDIREVKRSEENLKQKGEVFRAVPLCRSLFASPIDFSP